MSSDFLHQIMNVLKAEGADIILEPGTKEAPVDRLILSLENNSGSAAKVKVELALLPGPVEITTQANLLQIFYLLPCQFEKTNQELEVLICHANNFLPMCGFGTFLRSPFVFFRHVLFLWQDEPLNAKKLLKQVEWFLFSVSFFQGIFLDFQEKKISLGEAAEQIWLFPEFRANWLFQEFGTKEA